MNLKFWQKRKGRITKEKKAMREFDLIAFGNWNDPETHKLVQKCLLRNPWEPVKTTPWNSVKVSVWEGI